MSRSVYSCELALVQEGVQRDVTISVENGRFVSVEDGVPAPSDAIRLRGITLPGLANAHSHAFHRALRSRTQTGTGSFWTWRDLMYRAAERLEPDLYHRLARAVFGEMALAGITTVGEFHYVHHQHDGTPYSDPNSMGESILAAAAEAGIRITLLDTLYLHGGVDPAGYVAVEGAQRRYSDRSATKWAERVELLKPLAGQRVGAAIHSVRAVDADSIRVAASWAEERDTPVHAHVSEQPAENEHCIAHHGLTPTELLQECGVLGGRFSAVHGTHLTSGDISKHALAGSTVCLCPTTERDLGDGIGPTSPLAKAGVTMTLGSDSHAVIDLFEEARAVELDERLHSQRRGVNSSGELLAMATINGHASLGWTDAGIIAPGNRADLVCVALDSVRTAGTTASTAAEAVVFAATAADVTRVVVDGKTIVENGGHQSMDVAAELHATITDLMGP